MLLPALQLQKTRGVRANILRIGPDEAHDEVLARLDGALSERTRMVIMSHIELLVRASACRSGRSQSSPTVEVRGFC